MNRASAKKNVQVLKINVNCIHRNIKHEEKHVPNRFCYVEFNSHMFSATEVQL
jgi:hypothetical protein